MNVDELKQACRDAQIGGFSRLKKAELVELLREQARATPAGTGAASAAALGEEDAPAGEAPRVVCQRCHQLTHHGKVDDALRPGWASHSDLLPDRFRDLVKSISEGSSPCVIVCLLDIFDVEGTLPPSLAELIGARRNELVLVANKADLLPEGARNFRVISW